MAETGKYLVLVVARRDAAGGRISVCLDDRLLKFHDHRSAILDLPMPHHPLSRASEAVEAVELTAGPHRWTVRYEGPSEGQKRAEIGLDFLWLRRLP